ncbi:MAG: vanadium-dependent haloperoxidase, partial [Cyanobacteria bacterium J06623_7]
TGILVLCLYSPLPLYSVLIFASIAITMAPAPPLIGADGEADPELALEMAEVYELAILRDTPFNDFESRDEDNAGEASAGEDNAVENSKGEDEKLDSSIKRLNDSNSKYIKIKEQTDRRRKVNAAGQLDRQTVFRGSSPGVDVGPYLSQFMLIGTVARNGAGSVADGRIGYGVLQIDQKVPIAEPGQDFMIDLPSYVEVQRGIQPPPEKYLKAGGKDSEVASDKEIPARRFISTPRDLATYVHYDELYEAYLNAGLILLRMGAPFDPAFDHLSGNGTGGMGVNDRRNASGFALFGGPHILTLVTEVATRALKAVRFQKFNNHIRLRPEALAARLELLRDPSEDAKKFTPPLLVKDVGKLKNCLKETLEAIANGPGKGTHFLPMAFPEGSPMHPSYGAGHATVAGACVTMLKAFFDTSAVLAKKGSQVAFKRWETGDEAVAFRSPPIGDKSEQLIEGKPNLCKSKSGESNADKPEQFLTLEGELNKLAANISIGRNMAGVHYFSDYYDSLRMGEAIAISILEEQALTYLTDPFILSLPTFDGDLVRIGRR